MRRFLTAAAAALLLVLGPAAPAWAHAALLRTDPADGTTVTAPPTAITFTFSDPVKQQFSTIVVTAADGVSYTDGAARAADRTLTQVVRPLPGGVIRVAWRTVSADGHPIEGRFSFTNAAAPAPSASAAPSPSAATPASGTPRAVVAGAVGVLLLGGGALWWRQSRAAARRRKSL